MSRVSDTDTIKAPPNGRLWLPLAGRALIIFAVALGYAWAAPEFFGPRRYEQSSWAIFLALHAVTFGAVMVVALSRRPQFGNLLLATAATLTWAYLFIFVWFNSWGT